MKNNLFLIETIYCNIFRWNYLRNEKYFQNLFLHFLNLDSVLNIFKENKTLLADVFLNLRTPKKVGRQMSKKSRFRGLLDNQHCRQTNTQLKSKKKHIDHIYWSLWRQFNWKKSLLMIWKILGLFVNPLTAEDKYSPLNRDNLFQYFEMELFKEKNFFGIFSCIFEIQIQFSAFSKKRSPS